MIRLIKLWLEKLVCKHKWESHYISSWHTDDDYEHAIRETETLICTECGKIKQINL